MKRKIENYPIAIKNIRKRLENYLKDSGLKSLILGVSGGIDSAAVAVLAHPVCEELGVNLIKYFCTNFREVDLTEKYHQFIDAFENAEDKLLGDEELGTSLKIRKGNIKARIRMFYLYDLAQKNKGMVLSTDNYTEYMLGFWTLYGDVGLISLLTKNRIGINQKYGIKIET